MTVLREIEMIASNTTSDLVVAMEAELVDQLTKMQTSATMSSRDAVTVVDVASAPAAGAAITA